MDHDHLFKELLTTFFREFLELFFPELARDLDPDFEIVSMSQELFTDLTLSESREVDLLMKVKFRGQETYFLVHIENQATAQSDFPRRMFRYFAHLTSLILLCAMTCRSIPSSCFPTTLRGARNRIITR